MANLLVPKAPLEAYTRKIIEDKLAYLGYELDEMNPNCNVFRERAKLKEQNMFLNGKKPDFLIYQTNTNTPIAVIEAKRMGVTLNRAIDQAIELYAKPLNVPVVFVFNGASFYSCSVDRKPLKIDKIEISDFVDEKTIISLINNNYEIESVPKGMSLSKEELITVFKKANKLLRKAGLRDGYERFSVFSDLLFLKLKEDFDDYGLVSDLKIDIDKVCNWNKLISKIPDDNDPNFNVEDSEVKSYLEDTIKPKLKIKYGDVFENSLNIKDESILIELIKLINSVDFSAVDEDVKGAAFEFFLRNVTNGNKDLGEYYTPRHIVKMIINLLNPKVGDKIYDPCCGTGGFLLECFKYLLANSNKNDKEIRKRIREESIFGREITSTARISKMNMILFGDGHSNIEQIDSLSKPIKEKYEIAISNIPYSQKTEYGNLYPFPSDNGDSVFVQHLWQSVKPGGKMAVIVPDPFLYNEDTKECRKWILSNSSEAIVISLPRGVFNPYTPTKTSILVCKKQSNLEKENMVHFDSLYFYIIRNDGFELGAKRRPIKGESDCNKFLMSYNTNSNYRTIEKETATSINVVYDDITKNDYNLFPFIYMEHFPKCESIDKLAKCGNYIEERNERFSIDNYINTEEECVILSVTKNGIYINENCTVDEMNCKSQKYKKVYPNDLVYNPHRINIGSIGVVPDLHKNMYVPQIYPVFYVNPHKKISPYFFMNILKRKEYQEIITDYCQGGARANLKLEWLNRIKFLEPTEKEKDEFNNQAKKLEKAYKQYVDLYTKICKM